MLVFELVSTKNSFQKQLKSWSFSQNQDLPKVADSFLSNIKKQRSRQFSKVVVHELPGSL